MIRGFTRSLANYGKYSSMLDLGGFCTEYVDASIDTGKNNKIRAIAIDYAMISRSLDSVRQSQRIDDDNLGEERFDNHDVENDFSYSLGVVNSSAGLLNLNKVHEDVGPVQTRSRHEKDDDTVIISSGQRTRQTFLCSHAPQGTATSNLRSTKANFQDIRTKYASNLNVKIDGGLNRIDNLKKVSKMAVSKRDAAYHFAVKDIVVSSPVPVFQSNSKWLASTGVGKFLSFLNSRSMIIALLPPPDLKSKELKHETRDHMNTLCSQLSHVKFDLLISGIEEELSSLTKMTDSALAVAYLKYFANKSFVNPNAAIVVSDRDEYMRAGKDAGMFTCRVRSREMPRGNVTTNYHVEDITDVEDVINEMNGISFKTVLAKARL